MDQLRKCFLATALLAQFTPPAAIAQTGSTVIEEVVVTAQRRESSLQETPISMTALSTGDLVDAHVKNLIDISQSVPGLVVSSTGTHGHFPFSIRGISPATIGTTIDDPVGIYVDEVYIGRAPGVMTDLFYVDRIEVLRGPQGTLYGRNTTAGAVNIYHKRATPELSGDFRVSQSSEDDLRLRFAVDGRLGSDNLLGSLAVAYTDQEGWGTNLFDGSKVGSQESKNLYAAIELAPSNDLAAVLRFDYVDQFSNDALKRVSRMENGELVLDIGNPDEFAMNDPNFVDLEVGGTSLNIDYNLGGLTFNSITAYRFFSLDGAVDSDGLAVDAMGNPGSQFNNVNDQEQVQFSQEFRITSASGNRSTWQAGLYAFHENGERVIVVTNFNAGAFLHRFSDTEARSFAVYGNYDYDLTEKVTLNVGIRFSDEAKNIVKEHDNVDLRNPDNPRPPLARVPLNTSSDSWTSVTPKIGLSYRHNDDLHFYVTATNGFKSGGFSDVGMRPAFDQEEAWSYEAGMKAHWLRRRLRTNLAAFHTDYEGLQINVSIAPSVFSIINAANATLQGMELELLALPSDRLRIEVSAAYLDAEYDNFLGLGNEQLAGNRLNRAPEWSGNLTMDYEFPVGDAGASIALRGSYSYQGSVFYTERNLDLFSAGSWENVDARIAYNNASDRWSLVVFGRNLTDDRHVTNITPLGGHPVAGINAPQEYGVEFNYSF